MRLFSSFAFLLLNITVGQAQVLTFDHGKVEFHTSSIMSDIEAISEKMDVTLDLESGEAKINIPIASFEFEYEMMQDHFNEEYLESEHYPNATFSGKIDQDISAIQGHVDVQVSGLMTIHGVTKPMTLQTTISKKDDLLRVRGVFTIVFKDFDVDEPSILTKSVAKDVEVKVLMYLK